MRNFFPRGVAALLVITLVALAGHAQEQTPQRAAGVLNEGVTAVLVDVVVRDRRGQPVRDLTDADFEILEDGVPQKLGALTRVFDGNIAPGSEGSSAAPPPSAATPAVGAPAPMRAGPMVTALVFHGLSPEGRQRALKAALGFVGDKEETSNYIGVFGIDLSLVPLVPFTRNGVAVRQALTQLATGATTAFRDPNAQQQRTTAVEQASSANQAVTSAIAGGGPESAAAVGGAAAAAQLAQIQASMVQGFEAMQRDQSGYITTDALTAIVSTFRRLPGRKSLVLFSEGIAVPTAVQRLFEGVIDAANRANVSIYTIDAAGLRTESEQMRIRNAVSGAASMGIETSYTGSGAGGAYTRGLEGNEDTLRSDAAWSLGTLARDTGGLLFNNTNNLGPAFERIESDARNYYLLGYTPLNPKFDGRFRTIQVKVKRQDVTVASRKGYYAVRNPGTVPINPSEAPALAAIDRKPVPNEFPIRAGSLLFPERGRPGLVPVVVEFKTAPLTFQPAADGKTYTSDFVVAVRFLDRDNQVVRKLSQHYDIRGDISQLERAKQGEVIFYRESELPPGIYSMETVVHDAPSGKASVRFSTVEVPQFDEAKLRMSSLVVVRRGEQVAEKDQRAGNPLLVNGVALSPNLGEPISKTAKELAFYFSIYPVAGRSPDVLIDLLQNGSRVTQLPMPVPPADASGRIQQLGRLPLDSLAPGTYELRAVVKQDGQQVARSTMLRIVE